MIDGILNVYKPQNISSNQVVVKIKKILGVKKVGHTGTLDPLACGVLPICIGSATKVSEYLLNKDKIYRVKLKFGMDTDTYDCEGNVVNRDPHFVMNKDIVLETLNGFIGTYKQVPPNYSAIKINGKRAYQLAREGIEFELKSREINIHYIDDIGFDEKNNECMFTVKCSKGTYIRSLCSDIAHSIGTFGTMTFLERIGSGKFTIDDSIELENLCKDKVIDNLIKIEDVLDFPIVKIDDYTIVKLLKNGVSVKNPKYINNFKEGLYLLNGEEGLIGIIERKLDFLKIIKFLN